jgi:hypothetical protein
MMQQRNVLVAGGSKAVQLRLVPPHDTISTSHGRENHITPHDITITYATILGFGTFCFPYLCFHSPSGLL